MSLSKKIIAFDLDGTLAESKQPLAPDMAQALVALALRKKVAVISGGSIEQYKKQFLVGFDQCAGEHYSGYDNIILMPTSGTEWYRHDQKEHAWTLTERETFPENVKTRVLEVLREMVASGSYDIPSESYGERIEDRGSQITLSALGQEAPIEKKKMWDPEQKIRQRMRAEFESKIPDVSVSIGGMTSLDILPKGFSKAVSLERLLAKLGYERGDLLYVGDALFPGGNDYAVAEAGLDTLAVSGPADTLANIQKWIEE